MSTEKKKADGQKRTQLCCKKRSLGVKLALLLLRCPNGVWIFPLLLIFVSYLFLFVFGRSSGPVLTSAEIIYLPKLADRLKNETNGVSPYIVSCLGSETKYHLSQYNGRDTDPAKLLDVLVADLNKLIQTSTPFYTPQLFTNIALRTETQNLLWRLPRGNEACKLNRMLLEDAFSPEISKITEPEFLTGADRFDPLKLTISILHKIEDNKFSTPIAVVLMIIIPALFGAAIINIVAFALFPNSDKALSAIRESSKPYARFSRRLVDDEVSDLGSILHAIRTSSHKVSPNQIKRYRSVLFEESDPQHVYVTTLKPILEFDQSNKDFTNVLISEIKNCNARLVRFVVCDDFASMFNISGKTSEQQATLKWFIGRHDPEWVQMYYISARAVADFCAACHIQPTKADVLMYDGQLVFGLVNAENLAGVTDQLFVHDREADIAKYQDLFAKMAQYCKDDGINDSGDVFQEIRKSGWNAAYNLPANVAQGPAT